MVICAAGTGLPFFTTDTGAALRAAEMGCDALFKGTSVDGVYDADPKKVADAKRYESVSFDRVLNDNLKVMDASAVALCRENNIPIVVFNIRETGNLARVLSGDGTATVVLEQSTGNPLVPLAPAIDYTYSLTLTRLGDDVQYDLNGDHDGYPGHDLLIGDHDPPGRGVQYFGAQEAERADERGDEAVGRLVVDFLRRADLLQHAVRHDPDPVGHRQGLALVVGDVDEGDVGPFLDRAQLGAHVLAQLEVERAQRLVEQHHLGLDRECSGDRHPLLLAARELAHGLVRGVGQVDQAQELLGPLAALGLVDPAHLEPEGDVLPDRHQREQRQVLEDQRGGTLVGADAAHVPAADPDGALGRIDEARNHAQDGGLAAAGRAEKGEELAGPDGDVDIVHRPKAAKVHGYVVELYVFAHPALPTWAPIAIEQGAGQPCKGWPAVPQADWNRSAYSLRSLRNSLDWVGHHQSLLSASPGYAAL